MNDIFLKACQKIPTPRTPVWIMRQAGRYMEEYRALRAQYDFWTLCRTPELATKVTLQPIEKLGVDAAILFSDILVVLPPLGQKVAFNPAPVISDPIRTYSQINNLKPFNMNKELSFVFDALKQIKMELKDRAALIGFAGAPFTMAAYMVEAQGSKNFAHIKSLLYKDKKAAHALLDFLCDIQAEFLSCQLDAGAQAVQIFDTWAGLLPQDLASEFIIPKIARLIEKIKKNHKAPVIYFIKDAAHILHLLPQTNADVISLDEKIPLNECFLKTGSNIVLQGNLDPTVLLTDFETITQKTEQILNNIPSSCFHIFNLGHGILPATPVENAVFLVNEVKRLSMQKQETS